MLRMLPYMIKLNMSIDSISVRLAQTAAEVEAAQKLRYKVFYEECAARPSSEAAENRIDRDGFDPYADHLIVSDHSNGAGVTGKIVGTYRLLRQESAQRYGRFYSSDEYDITPLLNSGVSLLELGRSCVLPEYRTRPILNLLWQGIADYITDNNIDLMFGCASLQGTDIQAIAAPLSYLHHYHMAPERFRARALSSRYIDMDIIPKDEINPRKVFSSLPPLIKGYLRLGGSIGDGAVIDPQFNTTDVCVIVQTSLVTRRYRKHYERKIQKPFPGAEEAEAEQTAGRPA